MRLRRIRGQCIGNLTAAFADEFVVDQREGLSGDVPRLDPARRRKLSQALGIAYNKGFADAEENNGNAVHGIIDGLLEAARDDDKGARAQNVLEAIQAFKMSAERHRERIKEIRSENRRRLKGGQRVATSRA